MSREEGMSKRQQRREQQRRSQQRSRLITIGAIVAVVLVVAFFIIWPNVRPVGAISTPEARTRTQVNGNGAGDPNAPIKIEEFSDFQCPYCERFYTQTESQFLSTFVDTGQVYFVYRSFGEFIGPESRISAEAAYCAGDQNKFWEMHDYLFANQATENSGYITNKLMTTFAQKIGLDMTKFTSCFNGGTYSSRVDQDQTDGRAAGISATPSFVLTYTVNGQVKTVLIEGAQPLSEFQSKIQAALTEMGK